jgi:riboflavin-specific deaminase-like protein
MTADGKIASANRRVSSFSSRRDKEHMMELRATADAVMSGARTVDLNRVSLGPGPHRYRRLRRQNGLAEYNLRVVVTRNGSLDPNAYLFKTKFSPIVVLTTRRASPERLERLTAVADEVKICGDKEIDFRYALRWLRKRWKIRRLLCEGGGEIDGGLFLAGVVNELHLTICPKVFGGRAAPTIADGVGVHRLADATHLKLKSAQRHGPELFLCYRVARPAKHNSSNQR